MGEVPVEPRRNAEHPEEITRQAHSQCGPTARQPEERQARQMQRGQAEARNAEHSEAFGLARVMRRLMGCSAVSSRCCQTSTSPDAGARGGLLRARCPPAGCGAGGMVLPQPDLVLGIVPAQVVMPGNIAWREPPGGARRCLASIGMDEDQRVLYETLLATQAEQRHFQNARLGGGGILHEQPLVGLLKTSL